ncbi:hypothetical protein [Bdellovibrio sp. HCB2-146]|uniref:hypothetical protein n=1 Tax=Bdellovibrio sp. HCB2-146 TaxID=3394362 RepID=UPI0039BC8D37
MNAKKFLSVMISTALSISSTQSLAKTENLFRSFDSKSSEQIQREIEAEKVRLEPLLNYATEVDNFLVEAGDEGLLTDSQEKRDGLLRGAIAAAMAFTPIAVTYNIGFSEAVYQEMRKEDRALFKEAMDQAHAYHNEFIESLKKTFDTTTARNMQKLEKEYLQHIDEFEKATGKYTESIYAARNILPGLRSNIRFEIEKAGGDAGKIFLANVEEYLQHHAFNKRFMTPYGIKVDALEARLSKKRWLGVLVSGIAASAGGAFYYFTDNAHKLSDRNKDDIKILLKMKKDGLDQEVENYIDKVFVNQAKNEANILAIQERIILLETVLMMRGTVEK